MRAFITVLLLALLAAPAAAQQPCGNGIPCKPVSWPLPEFPELVSPTPLSPPGDFNNPPTNTPTNTPTRTPIATSTAIATFTPFIDADEIGDSLATVQALLDGTQAPVLNASGTPVSIETEIGQIGGNAEVFVGYVRTIQGADIMGPFAPLAAMLFTGITIVLLFKIATFMLPILAALFGIIRKVVNIILDFIPF